MQFRNITSYSGINRIINNNWIVRLLAIHFSCFQSNIVDFMKEKPQIITSNKD